MYVYMVYSSVERSKFESYDDILSLKDMGKGEIMQGINEGTREACLRHHRETKTFIC